MMNDISLIVIKRPKEKLNPDIERHSKLFSSFNVYDYSQGVAEEFAESDRSSSKYTLVIYNWLSIDDKLLRWVRTLKGNENILVSAHNSTIKLSIPTMYFISNRVPKGRFIKKSFSGKSKFSKDPAFLYEIFLYLGRDLRSLLCLEEASSLYKELNALFLKEKQYTVKKARDGLGFFKEKVRVEKRGSGVFESSLWNRSKIKPGMHIVFSTMLWKRHGIFNIWAKNIVQLQKEFPEVKISCLVAGSEGKKSRTLVNKYKSNNFHYIETPNMPLGRKANIRLVETKKLNPDYVVLLGSDDIFCKNAFLIHLIKMSEGIGEIAFLDIYYYNYSTKKSAYSHGYQGFRLGEPVAPGRALSRKALDKLGWKLWDPNKVKNLDSSSRDKIKGVISSKFYYSCREHGVYFCDIKSDVNLTKFDIRFNYEELDSEILEKEFEGILLTRVTTNI